MENIYLIAFFSLLIVLLAGGIFGYLVFLGNQQSTKYYESFQENQLKLQNREDLDACLKKADMAYSVSWAGECPINGMDSKVYGECNELPTWDVKILEDRRNADKQNCFKQYPQ